MFLREGRGWMQCDAFSMFFRYYRYEFEEHFVDKAPVMHEGKTVYRTVIAA